MTDFRTRDQKRRDALTVQQLNQEADEALALLAARIEQRDAEIATLKLAVETVASKLHDTQKTVVETSDATADDLEKQRAELTRIHSLILSIGENTRPAIAATHDHHSKQMTDILTILKDL